LTSVASGALLYGSGGTTLNTLAIGSAGYILASNGTAPYWSSLSSLSIATGTGAANYIAKWTGTNTLSTSTITDTGTLVNIPGTTTLATTAGFVGIATSTPYSTEKLTVYGNIWGSGNIILQKGSYNITLTPATLTASQTITFPDLSGTVAVSSTAPITLSSTGVIGLTTPLAISYGGTATSSIGSAGSVVYSNGTTYAFTSVGIAGQPLLSGGSGAPTWGTLSTTYGGTGQNWSTVATGSLPYFSGYGTLGTLAIGSANTILASNGTAPYWASLSSLSIATGTGAANYIAKWTGTNTLSTSTITDDGSLVLVSNQFRTTATTTLATAGGYVGIGTTAPSYKLDVAGNIRAQTSLTAGINVESLTGDKTLTPGVDKMFQFLNPNGANRIVYLSTTTANPGDKFIIKNNDSYSSSYSLQIQQGSTILDSIYARAIREYIFDGTNWVSGDVGTGIGGSDYNVAIGYNALGYNSGVAVGSGTYGSSYGAAVGNYAFGYFYGAAVGYSANGYNSGVAVGYSASGYSSGAAVGYSAKGMRYGAALGYLAGYNIDTTADRYNVLVGAYSGYQLTTGIGNIIIGYQSGYDATYSPTTGSKNILIGFQAGTPATTTSNFLNIGNLIFATGINTATGTAISTGNVGIGTTGPGRKLDVLDSTGSPQLRLTYTDGSVYTDFFTSSTGILIIDTSLTNDTVYIGPNPSATGTLAVYKITTYTLDPLYTINGKTFATYAPSMTGVKEETTGVIKVEKMVEGKDYYQAEIDFNNLEEGSDLWLFSKVTALKKNIDKLSVLLTPAGRTRVWYQVDPQNFKLYFFAERPTTISYRLTAPRWDYEKWSNFAEGEGVVINEDGLVVSSSTVYQYSEENNEEGILEKVVSLIKETLEKLGLIIENGIAQIKEIITEKLSAKVVVTNQLCLGQTCIDEAKLKELLEKTGTIGATNNGTTNNGATSNGTASNGTTSNETVSNQPANNETANNATTSSEQQTMSNEQSGSEQLSSEQLSNEATSSEQSSNEQLSNEQSGNLTETESVSNNSEPSTTTTQ